MLVEVVIVLSLYHISYTVMRRSKGCWCSMFKRASRDVHRRYCEWVMLSILLQRQTCFLSLMVFNNIQSLCPFHFCCHSWKLPKEPFLLSHFYLTTSTFVTICLGTIIMNSNHRQDKTWLQTKSRLHVDLEDTEGKTAYVEYGMFA